MLKLIPILAIGLLLACSPPSKQEKKHSTQAINVALAQVLDSMETLDQKYRMELMNARQKGNSDELSELWTKQQAIDESNLVKLQEIISTYGFTGRSLVGEDGSRATFLLLQHSPDSIMEKYYDMIVKAGKDKELSMHRVAMFQDRVLMHRGEKQIYGTQIYSERKTNPVTGEDYDSTYVWPIENPEAVNDRRLEAGLNTTIEDYAAQFGIEYNSRDVH